MLTCGKHWQIQKHSLDQLFYFVLCCSVCSCLCSSPCLTRVVVHDRDSLFSICCSEGNLHAAVCVTLPFVVSREKKSFPVVLATCTDGTMGRSEKLAESLFWRRLCSLGHWFPRRQFCALDSAGFEVGVTVSIVA